MSRLYVLVLLLGALACGPAPLEVVRPSGDAYNLITPSDFRAYPSFRNAYDVIRNLRPNWLRSRSVANAPGILVVVNDAERSPLSALQTIPVEHICYLRKLSRMEATTR